MSADKPIPVKVPLCGESGDGKTSLIVRFWRDSFDEVHNSTQMPELVERPWCLNGKHYNMRMQDTVGQEKYGAPTPSIYRDASVILVCFDPTSPDAKAHIKKWVDMLDQYRPQDSKLILVATKCDLWDKESDPPIDLVSDENSDALCAEFHADSLWKTSSKTGRNVSEVFSRAAAIAPVRVEEQKLDQRDDKRDDNKDCC